MTASYRAAAARVREHLLGPEPAPVAAGTA